MASTRRLAAILAADMVGYSRVMGLDEAGTATALREHRAAADPLIAQQGGRIVRLPVTASSSSLGPWSASSNAPWRCNALAQKRAIALDSLENTIGHEEPFKMRKRDGDEGRGTPQSRTKRRERARQKGATTQRHRARVLEVRIQSPPAKSLQSGRAARSRGLRLPSKPAATASGWRAGSRRVGSRRT